MLGLIEKGVTSSISRSTSMQKMKCQQQILFLFYNYVVLTCDGHNSTIKIMVGIVVSLNFGIG